MNENLSEMKEEFKIYEKEKYDKIQILDNLNNNLNTTRQQIQIVNQEKDIQKINIDLDEKNEESIYYLY